VRNWRTRGQESGRKERRPTFNTGARAPERTAGMARTRRRSVTPARGLRGDGNRAREAHKATSSEGLVARGREQGDRWAPAPVKRTRG
jgi:hypothetical protein